MAIIRQQPAMPKTPKTTASRSELKELGRAVWVVVKSLKELEASYQVPIANENTNHDDGEACVRKKSFARPCSVAVKCLSVAPLSVPLPVYYHARGSVFLVLLFGSFAMGTTVVESTT